VIDCCDPGTTFTPAREGAHFHRGLGIHGEAEDVVCSIRRLIDLVYLGEDRVSFWDFFCG
jgi:hypothetical protein